MIKGVLRGIGSAGVVFSLAALSAMQVNAGAGRGEGIVSTCGRLQVKDAHVCAENGTPISLGGMSWFWSGWAPKYFNANTVNYLVDNFKMSVARAAYGCPESSGPMGDVQDIKNVVDACIARNVYVIIDWHGEGNLVPYKEQAKSFFADMVRTYGGNKHVIYELWNEPTGQSDNDIKNYCQELTNHIRGVEKQMGYAPHLIICGSRTWSQYPNSYQIDDPGSNVAYTFHGYFDNQPSHLSQLYNNAQAAMSMGNAVFVTEYGASYGNHGQTEQAIQWCQDHNISMTAWSVNDKPEDWSIYTSNMDGLTAIGSYYKEKQSNWKPVVAETVYPTSVAVDKTPIMLPSVGAKAQLLPVFTPADATETAATWASSDPGVATVSPTGVVTAVMLGSATVTVTVKDKNGNNLNGTCSVMVKNHQNVALNKAVSVSSVESNAPVSVVAANAVDGNATTRWSSAFSDPQWIQVDLGSSYKIYNVSLNWEAASAKEYSIETSADGNTWNTIATKKDMGSGARIDDLAVNSVCRYIKMNGAARTTKYGYSLLEFAVYGDSDTVIHATGVNIAPASIELATKGSCQLSAKILPAGATNQTVTWSSSNPAVAMVDGAGLVKGISKGTAVIIAQTVDGHFTGKCSATVSDVAVTGIVVAPTSITLSKGASSSLKATVTPASAANQTVTWSSSNPAVAAVDEKGLVRAVAPGKASITAKTNGGAFSAVCAVNVTDAWTVKIEAEAATNKTGSPHTEACSEGGLNMGWIGNGDWMIYNVNIPVTGTYTITYRVASPNSTGQLILGKNGTDVSPTISVPNTGSWQTWTTITTTAKLQAGVQDLTVYAKTGGFNINWWSITSK